MRRFLALLLAIGFCGEAMAVELPGIATRGKPVKGYAANGVIGLLWHDARVFDGLPGCADAGVLAEISAKFTQKEAMFWNSSLAIAGADRFREVRGAGYTLNNLPRRGCIARIQTTDGRLHSLSYTISAANGALGYGWGVSWCVSGLDRGWAYSPECKRARP